MDFGDSLQRLVDVTFEWLPRLVGALVILLVALIVGNIVKRVVTRLVGRLRVEERVEALPGGGGATRYLGGASVAGILGVVAKVLVLVVGLAVAADVADVDVITEGIAAVVAYLPNVLAAALIVVAALVLASLAGPLAARIGGDRQVTRIARVAVPAIILTVGSFMALAELEVATEIVVGTYYIVLGGIALGAALAFGLGGREHAARFLDEREQGAD